MFEALVGSAVRLCEAESAFIYLRDGDIYRLAANHGFSREFEEFAKQHPLRPGRGTLAGRTALEAKIVHIPDVLADSEYNYAEALKLASFRTMLGIPLLREGTPIGVIALTGDTVQPFTDRQIELVSTFADQAVIAIENARLFNEVQARTRELSESLEQQTATSDVLKVISSSPGELEPVFQAMLENATRICEAKFGTLYRYDGGAFHPVTFHKVPSSLADFLRQRGPFVPPAGIPLERLLRTKKVIHTIDQASDQVLTPSAKLGGARTHIAVPMLKEDELVGAIIIYRQEVRPFTDKQIELVTNFAAQAVIAIENTRLLNELRESLQQQTATADVLKVISSSPGELEAVFQAMLENATRICDAKFGNIYRWDGDSLRLVATHNTPPAYDQLRRSSPFRPGPETATGRMLTTKSVTHVADLALEPGYVQRDPLSVEGVEVGGIRTLLSVPMLKENELIGAFSIYRDEVRPFTDKQIELVKNFASQAVIAIENARLLNELRESLEQQTATADVLKVISRSAFNLQTVLDTLVEFGCAPM